MCDDFVSFFFFLGSSYSIQGTVVTYRIWISLTRSLIYSLNPCHLSTRWFDLFTIKFGCNHCSYCRRVFYGNPYNLSRG